MPADLHIFHGDNTIQSRSDWLATQKQFIQKGYAPTQENAKQLDRAKLETLLSSQSLFGDEAVLSLEGLLSLPQSKKKKSLIDSLVSLAAQSSMPILLWEPKLATAAALRPFKTARVHTHKASKQIFTWLDSLGQPQKGELVRVCSELIEKESAIFIHTMLVRQIRMLIAAKDGGVVAGASFMIKNVQTQARRFQLQQLLNAHQQLLEIEYRQKQGITRLSWEQELDLWLISL